MTEVPVEQLMWSGCEGGVCEGGGCEGGVCVVGVRVVCVWCVCGVGHYSSDTSTVCSA